MKREKFYEAVEPDSHSIEEPRIREVERILRRRRQPVERLLDIGCSDGAIAAFLGFLLKAKEICGVDISEKAVEEARGKGIKAHKLDMEEEGLPFEDDWFDAVFCGEVIEHLFDPDHLLDEIYRVLKPGAFCILTTPNLAGWRNRLVIMAGFQPYFSSASLSNYNVGKVTLGIDSGAGRDHLRNFTLRGLRDLLVVHDFQIKSCRGSSLQLSGIVPRWGFPIAFAEKLMAKIPSLATRLIIEAEKPCQPTRRAS
jgi:methionine biosynthesis protein MetW